MNSNVDTSIRSVPEVLLMLRAPGADWLATLLTAIDEASHDPAFSARHRAVLAHYLDDAAVPAAVAEAARQRAEQFEAALTTQSIADRRRSGPRLAVG